MIKIIKATILIKRNIKKTIKIIKEIIKKQNNNKLFKTKTLIKNNSL